MSVGIYKCRYRGIYKCQYRGIYKCRWGFINVEVNLQMMVGICKCQRGFTNASIIFRKCLHFYSSPLFLNFDTNGTPYISALTFKLSLYCSYCCLCPTETDTVYIFCIGKYWPVIIIILEI